MLSRLTPDEASTAPLSSAEKASGASGPPDTSPSASPTSPASTKFSGEAANLPEKQQCLGVGVTEHEATNTTPGQTPSVVSTEPLSLTEKVAVVSQPPVIAFPPPSAPPFLGVVPKELEQQQCPSVEEPEHSLKAKAPAHVKRLGRHRPAVLTSRLHEFGFVCTIVLSAMLSDYFIDGFNIILPSVAEVFAMSPSAQTWPAGVTNLTTAALLQPFSRLCDTYGGRQIFICGHAWLCLWSLVSGFSKNTLMLILCRGMQGIGAAAFLPAGLTLLSQTYRPGPRKNLVFSIYAAFTCVGFYCGILMGAIAAEYLTWRWYFWTGAILALLVAILSTYFLPWRLDDANPDVQMDWWGVCTIVPGIVLVVFAFTDGGTAPNGWRTPYIYITLGLGFLFLSAAVYVEGWVAAQPLLPPELFKHRGIKRLIGSLFCSYGVFGLYLFYASFYIENVMHATPMLTAAWFVPLAVGGIFLTIGGGLVLHVVSNRVLMLISCLGFLLSMLLFALLPNPAASSNSTSFFYWAYIFPSMLAMTIGIDIAFNVTNVFITSTMPRRHSVAASGLISSILYLGIAFWLGIADLAVSATAQSRGLRELEPQAEYQIGFWTGVALSVSSFGLVVSVKMGQAEAK